jgi:hypothetical protein
MLPALRPFGTAGDLDLEFGQPDRPALVTALLVRCSERGDAAFWWRQQVGLRSAALLRILGATEGRPQLTLTARCGRLPCAADFEFGLPLDTLAGQDDECGPIRVELPGCRFATLRLPTGADLRRWHDTPPASRAGALRMMLAALVVEGAVGPADEAIVSDAIAERDPLVAFAVHCACPACGAPQEVTVDLEGLALARLAARQRALLREVHCMAGHYGWTEQEVLALAPSRRARYLAVIEEDR